MSRPLPVPVSAALAAVLAGGLLHAERSLARRERNADPERAFWSTARELRERVESVPAPLQPLVLATPAAGTIRTIVVAAPEIGVSTPGRSVLFADALASLRQPGRRLRLTWPATLWSLLALATFALARRRLAPVGSADLPADRRHALDGTPGLSRIYYEDLPADPSRRVPRPLPRPIHRGAPRRARVGRRAALRGAGALVADAVSREILEVIAARGGPRAVERAVAAVVALRDAAPGDLDVGGARLALALHLSGPAPAGNEERAPGRAASEILLQLPSVGALPPDEALALRWAVKHHGDPRDLPVGPEGSRAGPAVRSRELLRSVGVELEVPPDPPGSRDAGEVEEDGVLLERALDRVLAHPGDGGGRAPRGRIVDERLVLPESDLRGAVLELLAIDHPDAAERLGRSRTRAPGEIHPVLPALIGILEERSWLLDPDGETAPPPRRRLWSVRVQLPGKKRPAVWHGCLLLDARRLPDGVRARWSGSDVAATILGRTLKESPGGERTP